VWLAAACCASSARAEPPAGGEGDAAAMQARAQVRAERAVAVDDATASATSVCAQDGDSALRDVPQAIVQVPGVHVQQTGGLGRADNDYAYLDDGQTRFDSSDDRTLHQRNAQVNAGDGLVHAGVDALGGRLSFLLAGDGRTEGVPGLLARPTAEAHRLLVRVL